MVKGVSKRFFQHIPPLQAGLHLLLASFGSYGYEDEAHIRQAILKVRKHTKVGFERLASLWQQVKYLDKYDIKGAIVECGVWRGGCMGMAALAHQNSVTPPTRKLHLFDSFVGMPEPNPEKDGDSGSQWMTKKGEGKLEPIGACVAPQQDCKTLLEDSIRYPSTLIDYHVGWFQNTVPKADLGPIALLRLDGDWYESTKVCLDSLYDEVVDDGVIVIDDYGHFEGCRRAVDEFVASRKERIFLNHIDYTGRYWIKRQPSTKKK